MVKTPASTDSYSVRDGCEGSAVANVGAREPTQSDYNPISSVEKEGVVGETF